MAHVDEVVDEVVGGALVALALEGGAQVAAHLRGGGNCVKNAIWTPAPFSELADSAKNFHFSENSSIAL